MGKEKRLARKAKKAVKEAEMKELYKDEDSVIEYSGGKPVMKTGGMVNPNKVFNPFDLKSSNFKKQ